MKTLLKNRELSAFLAIVVLFAGLVALNPAYFSLQTLGMIFASSQILCLLALGATLVMLTRNIDVSVGSTVGLSAIATGVALNSGYGLMTAIAFALAIGALAGAFNGLLVVGLRIPAIVATLGTLGLYRGVMLLWTGGKWIEGLPNSLKALSEPAFIGISPLGWLVLALLLAGGGILSRTAFGRDFYAVGDNLAAARQLGVAVNRTRMLAFTLNGLLVVGLRIPAIVATLGTLGLYRGVMLLWTGGKWIEGLPNSLKALSEPAFIGISPLGWLVLALLLAGGGILSRTAFGRDFYAVGDNLAAARQLGVAVNRTRMLAFTLNGMLAACAGIVFAAQIGFVPNQTGSGLEMKAIAACVLGGISLLGGTGTLLGAFLGAFFLTQIDTVLVLFRLPAWWNDFIAGLVLLGVLVLDGRLRQALTRHQRALKYSRFQPGNKGGKRVAPFPERKNKEVA